MFVGRFIYEWSDLQQDYLVLQRIVSRKHSGTSWITGVIQIIWKHVYQNWDARNADFHGVDAATQESAKYAQAQRVQKKSTRNALLSSLEIGMYSTVIPMNTLKKKHGVLRYLGSRNYDIELARKYLVLYSGGFG